MSSGYLIIVVNPHAGRGRAGRLVPAVMRWLKKHLPDTEVRVIRTRSVEHAIESAHDVVAQALRSSPNGRDDILAMMGGDGMTNIGLNACVGTDVRLSILPAGSGNDFARGAGIPTRLIPAVRLLVAGRSDYFDVLEVTSVQDPRERRIVGSVVSTGLDARVNQFANESRWAVGMLAYLHGLVHEVRKWEPVHYRVTVDGTPHEFDAILFAVANAGYVGSGIHLVPDADPTDGKLDVTMVPVVPRRLVLQLAHRIYDGGFVQHPLVRTYRGQHIRIDGEGLLAMGDGEVLVQPPLDVRVLPGAVRICVPNGSK